MGRNGLGRKSVRITRSEMALQVGRVPPKAVWGENLTAGPDCHRCWHTTWRDPVSGIRCQRISGIYRILGSQDSSNPCMGDMEESMEGSTIPYVDIHCVAGVHTNGFMLDYRADML